MLVKKNKKSDSKDFDQKSSKKVLKVVDLTKKEKN